MASLDVKNLFTNIPVHKTIKIMIENIYNHLNSSSSYTTKNPQKLLTCTTKVSFYDPSGKIYIQIDGISKGLPLDPTISKLYMSHIENKISKTRITKLKTYIRYVDDIFIATHFYYKLKQTLEKIPY